MKFMLQCMLCYGTGCITSRSSNFTQEVLYTVAVHDES